MRKHIVEILEFPMLLNFQHFWPQYGDKDIFRPFVTSYLACTEKYYAVIA